MQRPGVFLLGILLVMVTVIKVSQGHMTSALYHTSVNFTCDPFNEDVHASLYNPGDLRHLWILPNDDLLEAGTTGHTRVDVLSNGVLLHVRDVDDADFGLYYCLTYVYPLGRYFVHKHGLNVDGPYWGDLFEMKYRRMVITGLVAGAVCFVFMGLLCFLYNKHQARQDMQAEENKAAALAAIFCSQDPDSKQQTEKSVTHYDNPAYVTDTESMSAEKAVTKHTSFANAEEMDGGQSRKGRAPQPPVSVASRQAEQQELHNVVAVADVDNTVSLSQGVTKL